MKTKQVPIIITLIAGLITCIIGFVMQMETGQFVKIWGIVLISFYILACVAKLEATEEAAEGAEALEGEEAEAGGAVSAEEME